MVLNLMIWYYQNLSLHMVPDKKENNVQQHWVYKKKSISKKHTLVSYNTIQYNTIQ